MQSLTLIPCVVLCGLVSYIFGVTVTPAESIGSQTVGVGITFDSSWISPRWFITSPFDICFLYLFKHYSGISYEFPV